MGTLFSKEDSKHAQKIEADVIDLIYKSREEGRNIHDYVKNHILKALKIYSGQIEAETKKTNLSYLKVNPIKSQIDEARKLVSKLPCKHYQLRNLETDQDFHRTKNTIFDMEKQIDKNTVDANRIEKMLQHLTELHQKLRMDPQVSAITPFEEDRICILFLKLFIKCPPINISTILQKNSNCLDNIIEDLDQLSADNVSPFNFEETRKMFEEMSLKAGRIKSACDKSIGHMEKKKDLKKYGQTHICNKNYNMKHQTSCKIGKYEEMLDFIYNKLNENRTIIQNFCPPIDERFLRKVENEISDLIDVKLAEVDEKTSSLAHKKKMIYSEGSELIHCLKNIAEKNNDIYQKLKLMREFEDKIFSVGQMNICFQEKKKILEEIKNEVNNIESVFDDIRLHKTALLDKIEGILIIELAKCLRQICKLAHKHKMSSEEFPFPKCIPSYNAKCEEIILLFDQLKDLPNDYPNMNMRIEAIREKIESVLTTLKERAEYNEMVFCALECLAGVQKKIVEMNSASNIDDARKLSNFIACRREMEYVDARMNSRLLKKKLEVYTLIHNYENTIFSGDQLLLQIIVKWHEYEKLLLHSTNAKSADTNERDVVSSMKMIREHFASDATIAKVFAEYFQCVTDLSNKNLDRATNSYIERLNEMDRNVDSLEQNTEFLQGSQAVLSQMRESCKIMDVLKKIKDLQEKIDVKKYQIDLDNKVKELTIFENYETVSPSSLSFQEAIDKLIFLKESVEDMPQSLQKQKFLQQVLKCLQFIDERLVTLVTVKQPSESILQLKNHFTFNTSALDVPKNTIKFVEMIHQNARNFEGSVQYYLGSNDSVDYYIIHENLVRLLHELDTVICDEDNGLVQRVIQTVEYIKDLIRQLDLNASHD